MSLSCPSSPSGSPGPGLSAEELAERELRALMSSPPSTIGVQALGEDDVDGLDLEQSGGLAVSSTSSSTSVASIRQDLVMARRRAVQLKLHPYQREAVEEFIKVIPVFILFRICTGILTYSKFAGLFYVPPNSFVHPVMCS